MIGLLFGVLEVVDWVEWFGLNLNYMFFRMWVFFGIFIIVKDVDGEEIVDILVEIVDC